MFLFNLIGCKFKSICIECKTQTTPLEKIKTFRSSISLIILRMRNHIFKLDKVWNNSGLDAKNH